MTKLNLRSIMMVLSIIGLVDSLYLYIIKITNNKNLCLQGIGDCWSVNISRFSEIAGVPISLLGAGAYLTLIILIFLEGRYSFFEQNSPLLIFGITLFGVIYSLYLTYIEIYVIKAICPFCVISAVVMVFLFALAISHLVKTNQQAVLISD